MVIGSENLDGRIRAAFTRGFATLDRSRLAQGAQFLSALACIGNAELHSWSASTVRNLTHTPVLRPMKIIVYALPSGCRTREDAICLEVVHQHVTAVGREVSISLIKMGCTQRAWSSLCAPHCVASARPPSSTACPIFRNSVGTGIAYQSSAAARLGASRTNQKRWWALL